MLQMKTNTQVLRNSLTLTHRNLLKTLHNPDNVSDVTSAANYFHAIIWLFIRWCHCRQCPRLFTDVGFWDFSAEYFKRCFGFRLTITRRY